MKEGVEAFIHHAKLLRRYGAAVVVMAFDEQGRADTRERKIEICRRAYRILTEEVGFPPEDIIFDPNILPSPPVLKSTTTTRRTLSALVKTSNASCRTR